MAAKPDHFAKLTAIKASLHDNGVLLLTLNRPDKLNAWDNVLLEEISAIWPLIANDPAVRVLVITGAGKAFSVGGDIDLVGRFHADVELSTASSALYTAALRGLLDLHKPVIAAVNGDVLGGGVGLVLSCDVIFMARNARIFCGSQLNINVLPAPEVFLWPARGVSSAKAKYHLFNSSRLGAEEAERIGLISAVFDTDQLQEQSLHYAASLAARDALMLSWTKRALNFPIRAASPLLDEWLAMEALSFARGAADEGIKDIRREYDLGDGGSAQ